MNPDRAAGFKFAMIELPVSHQNYQYHVRHGQTWAGHGGDSAAVTIESSITVTVTIISDGQESSDSDKS
jgi:hypothetical protein